MRRILRNIGPLAALAACAVLIAWTSQAGAQEETSMIVEPTMTDDAMAPLEMAAPEAEMAAPEAEVVAEPADVIQPCIDYRTHRSARRMLRCTPQVKVVMVAQNAADCCLYEVPLCIPCCCEGEEPCITSDCGRRGRGTVTYCWPCCGFEAEVVFKGCNEVKVHYRG